jgi:hypothetical protein
MRKWRSPCENLLLCGVECEEAAAGKIAMKNGDDEAENLTETFTKTLAETQFLVSFWASKMENF